MCVCVCAFTQSCSFVSLLSVGRAAAWQSEVLFKGKKRTQAQRDSHGLAISLTTLIFTVILCQFTVLAAAGPDLLTSCCAFYTLIYCFSLRICFFQKPHTSGPSWFSACSLLIKRQMMLGSFSPTLLVVFQTPAPHVLENIQLFLGPPLLGFQTNQNILLLQRHTKLISPTQ